jgi:signal transduction histidine kinase
MLKLANLEVKVSAEKSYWKEDIRSARALVERAIETTAALAQGLSPVIGHFGLRPGLAQLTIHAQTIYGIQCSSSFPSDWPANLDGSYANHVYRIAQEAISNAVKHGKATRVGLEVRIIDGRFLLTVADNGVGIPEPRLDTTGLGLRIMHYRARSLGGTLSIIHRPEGGTLVACSCPLPP